MRSALVALVCVFCAGCSGALAKGDGTAFGTDLGRFSVDAKIESTTCGLGAMGSPSEWTFDVVLSEDAPEFYWNTGADAVTGVLTDGTNFSLRSDTVVNIDGPNGGSASCTVVRTDDASGKLDARAAPRAFTGSLEYRFAPQGSSDCSELTTEGVVLAFPCTMTYALKAAWTGSR